MRDLHLQHRCLADLAANLSLLGDALDACQRASPVDRADLEASARHFLDRMQAALDALRATLAA